MAARSIGSRQSQAGTVSRRRLLQVTLGAAGAGLLGAGLSGAVSAAQPAPSPSVPAWLRHRAGGRVTLGTAQDFPGLDPMLTTLLNGNNLHTLLWNALTKYDELMEVQPDLAERWDVVDAQTFVFYLRQGVKFHNGREMTSDDVKFSIERVLDPETKSPYRSYVEKVSSVDAVDKYTVKVNLSKPNVIQHAELSTIKIMPKESIGDAVKNPVGTGPFRFGEFVPGDHVTLKRFDGYWDSGKPMVDEFGIQIIKDDISLYNAFKSGQFDMLWQLVPANVKEVNESGNLRVLSPKISGNSMILQVDDSLPPFDRKEARQALMYALDKETVFDLAYFNIGWLAKTNSNLVPNHWAYNGNLKERGYDIQRAKELFREAGVKEGYTIRYNALSGLWREWIVQGELLQQALKECGINLDIRPVDLSEWVSLRAPGKHTADLITPNGNERAWDPSQQLKGNSCNEAISRVYYCNQEVDALLDQGLAEFDPEKRKQIYNRVQEILWDEVPWVTTHHRPLNHAGASYVKGVYVDGQGNLHLDGVYTER